MAKGCQDIYNGTEQDFYTAETRNDIMQRVAKATRVRMKKLVPWE
jgi:hypothetical protein